ncbi:MAG: glycosyltransferase family 1 protein [Simkaniaceae bacterium]|nr:glycosyltransferase family 1 protein [Simkaniaceae bacterium]
MKTYKILRIAGLHYQAIKKKIYFEDKNLANKSYHFQQETIFQKHLLYSNSLAKAMRKLGHQAEEIIYDLEILQKTWARENDIPFTEENWEHEILLKQIAHLKPDILYFQDIHALTHEIRKDLKNRFPFIKQLVIFRGFPGISEKLLEELAIADVLFTGSPILYQKCQNAGLCPHMLYHSFDPDILDCIAKTSPPQTIDFSFAGSSGVTYGLGHHERYWTLELLLTKTPIELFVEEGGQNSRKSFQKALRPLLFKAFKHLNVKQLVFLRNQDIFPKKVKILLFEIANFKMQLAKHPFLRPKKQWNLPTDPLSKIYPDRCNPSVFGLEMFQILSTSKVTFNIHSTPAKGASDNIRLFQATGVGTCLLSDTGTNMPDLFEQDQEIVTYSSIEECIENLRYLLENPSIREKIAKNGQKRTLKCHTNFHRAREMDAIFQDTFKSYLQ